MMSSALSYLLCYRIPDPDSHPGMVIVKTIIFFIIAVVGGFVIFKLFLALDKRYPHTRRIPIVAMAFCFALSYVAEKYFGIADITGAYIAGIVLCNLSDNTYIERKVDAVPTCFSVLCFLPASD